MKVRLLVTTLLLCLLAGASMDAMPGSFSKEYRDAVRLYENGMYDRARVIFEKIQGEKDDPMSAGYAVLCAIHTKAVGYPEAVDSYGRMYGETPLSSQIHNLYAHTLFDAEHYAEAALQFDMVNSKGMSRNQYSELLFKRAYCDYALGDYSSAKTEFEKVIKRPASEFTAPSRYAMGYMFYTENSFSEAFPHFVAASKDSRFEQQAQYYILECKFMDKDYQYVAEHGDEIYDKVPEERKPRLARILSESYLVQGNAGMAKKYYDVAIPERQVLNSADAFYAGSLQFNLGDYKAAIDNFTQMENMVDSVGQIASYQLGYSYIQTKNKVAAMNSFRNASALDYDAKIKEDALFNYAKLSFDLNNDPSGFQEYLTKYNESGRNDMIHDYIAVASLYNHDYAGAVAAYDKVESLTPSMKSNYMKANYLRAEQLIDNGSYRDAVPCLKAATFFTTRQDNINKLSRYWLAECYFRLGNFEEAQKSFTDLYNQSALDNKDEGRRLPYNLGYCYFENADYELASTWFDKYIASGDRACREDAMIRRADCDFIARDYKSAVQSYDKVTSEFRMSDNLYPYYQQGVAYGLLGKRADKITVLSKVLDSSPSYPFFAESVYELGRTYVAEKQESRAVDCFRNIISNSSDSIYVAKSLIELGMIERNNSRNAQALDYYKKVAEKFRGSEEAEDALLAIESIYQSQGEPEKYLAYTESLGRPAKDASEKELVYFNSAEQIFLTGNYEKALVAIDKYMNEYPDGARVTLAHFYRAESYKSLGLKEKACDSYSKVIDSPEAGDKKELALANFAELSYGMEHYAEAYSAYSALVPVASIPGNKLAGKVGMMRSAFQARNYPEAISAAESVKYEAPSSKPLVREADYVTAKSLLATSKRDLAYETLRELAKQPDTDEGAEAAYLVIQDMYDQGNFDVVEKEVYKFADAAPSQAYWLAKSFIVLGDTFAENENFRQAKVTFESVLNGYQPAEGKQDDILSNVRMRLEKLNQLMNK